jgi:hypothetical protein
MRLVSSCAVALLAIAAASRYSGAAEVIDFSKLPQGDTIRVEYRSAGCFHFCTNTLEFVRSRSTRVTLLTNSSPAQNSATLPLTPEEVRGLDQLLEFYRQPRPGGCTTVDTIVFTRLRGNSVVATETFTDASCIVGRSTAPEVTKSITSLHNLVFRLEGAQLRPRRTVRGRP